MRQIDADKLKNDIMNIRYNCVGMRTGKVLLSDFAAQYREDILATIDEQPTAYDIDKVVEQLEAQKNPHANNIFLGFCQRCVWRVYNSAIDKAIEIVKGNFSENPNSSKCVVEVNKTSEGGAE